MHLMNGQPPQQLGHQVFHLFLDTGVFQSNDKPTKKTYPHQISFFLNQPSPPPIHPAYFSNTLQALRESVNLSLHLYIGKQT